MFKKLFLICILLIGSSATNIYAETWASHLIESHQYSYRIIASDFTEHKLSIRYDGILKAFRHQTGKGGIRDTRECHYGFDPVVERRYNTPPLSSPSKLKSISFITKDMESYNLYENEYAQILKIKAEVMNLIGDDVVRIVNDCKGGYIGRGVRHILTLIPRFGGRTLGKIFGNHLNCGELGPTIHQIGLEYEKGLKFNLKLSEINHYLFIWSIYKNWAYFNPNEDKYYDVLFVYPEKLTDEKIYEQISKAMVERIYAKAVEIKPRPNEINNAIKTIRDPHWQEKLYTDLIQEKLNELDSLYRSQHSGLQNLVTQNSVAFWDWKEKYDFQNKDDKGINKIPKSISIGLPLKKSTFFRLI